MAEAGSGSDEFYLRYYVGHKGKFGHEFMEFEFRPDGKLRYANNSKYKNDTMIRKEGALLAGQARPLLAKPSRDSARVLGPRGRRGLRARDPRASPTRARIAAWVGSSVLHEVRRIVADSEIMRYASCFARPSRGPRARPLAGAPH